MIRHVLLFRFHEQVPDVARQDLLDQLRALPVGFPSMERFALGPNRSRRDDTFSFAMHAEFRSWADLEGYLGSPAHEAFVRERFQPLVDQRAIASIEDAP